MGNTTLSLTCTIGGVVAIRYRRSFGGDAVHVVMAQGVAPWLRAFATSRWTVTGDREKFANAWRGRLELQFSAAGMLHLPPPPDVPLIQLVALVVATAKAAPKAAPKKAP